MASSPKFVCLFFLLTILVCSIQTYARDSQFFSKVTRNRDDATPTTTINPNTNNNYFTNNKVDDFVPLNKLEKKDEQPVFLPQTTETGYGLYGLETGLDAPSTTTTTPNTLYNMDENNNQKYENFNNYYKNNNNENNYEKNYTPELKGLSGTTYAEKTPISYNNFNDEGLSYNNGKDYGASFRYNNGAVEKQGMSDTRFVENGKYFYDLNAENNNNNNNNVEKYYYDVDNVENKYNNGNKESNYYEDVYNNNKYNNNNNNNNRFFNGNGKQEEFDFDQP
ncbi:protein E6-like [Chenopodium quinoa]|uniref:protein E6-like n=1 Tax=Chenopodium quinoa TaxID=63459 RepID=UPI000B798C4C|nr:protein E6-like [Chenopodium quinoa]